MKIVVVFFIFIVLVLVGEQMFGWIGAIAAVGVTGVVALIVFRGSKHASGSSSGGSG
jgi:hypothetical protein